MFGRPNATSPFKLDNLAVKTNQFSSHNLFMQLERFDTSLRRLDITVHGRRSETFPTSILLFITLDHAQSIIVLGNCYRFHTKCDYVIFQLAKVVTLITTQYHSLMIRYFRELLLVNHLLGDLHEPCIFFAVFVLIAGTEFFLILALYSIVLEQRASWTLVPAVVCCES